MNASPTLIRVDHELAELLLPLRSGRGAPDDPGPDNGALDGLLARAVWSRLVEPGDAVAGALVKALGPLPALDLISSGKGPRALEHAMRDVYPKSGCGPASIPVSQRELSAALKRWRPRIDRAATLRDLGIARSLDMRLVTPEDAAWPTALDDLDAHAPIALWVRGDVASLSEPSLAVVGARACTGYGSQITAELTGEACGAGITVVSGAAYGIDAVAHRTALAMGAPTIAVLAGGADRPYPASHDQLIARIAAQGTVCSELAPESAPTRWRFLQRNRIIAALSRAILVTEAGVRSGTLNTAGHGAEIGRPVGAVPGPITSAASAGCHRLIREYGATLITNGPDLLDLLGVSETELLFERDASRGSSSSGESPRAPSLHVRVLDALPLSGGRTLGEVARVAGIAHDEASGALAELELLRFVERRETPGAAETLWVLLRRE